MNALRLLNCYARARQGERRWPDREALERWQERKVVAHLRRVLPHSPWLRERFRGLPPGRWREVPVTGKEEAMARFEDWNTAGIRRGEAMAVALRAEETRDFSPVVRGISVGLSSGTSGRRALFLTSPREQEEWAGRILGRLLPPPEAGAGWGARAGDTVLPGRHRVALFLRSGGNLYHAAERGRVRFRWFDLMRPAASHWESLAHWQPTVLVAPPSFLGELAGAMERGREGGRNILSGIPWNLPRRIISCAETLDRLDRARLEASFGQKLHEVYQAAEGFLAATDSGGVLRLCEDGVVVEREWVDAERTRFVPVITDFRRITQPFIRHRLDDVLVPGPETGGIFTPLEAVEGRCEDTLTAETVRGPIPVFGDSVVRCVMTAADLEDFRVFQSGRDRLQVSLRPDTPEGRDAIGKALGKLWHEAGGNVEVSFTGMPDPGAGTPGVKRRRVRRLIPLPEKQGVS